MLKYNARHYDADLKLKVPLLLWLALLFGVRHFFLVALAGLMPSESETTAWVGLQAHYELLACNLPALLVLLATGHRIPDAMPVMRWIWRHGRLLVALSYISTMAGFCLLNRALLANPASDGFGVALFILATDMFMMTAVLRSELLKDLFLEFPDPVQAGAPSPKPVSSVRALAEDLDRQRRAGLLTEPLFAVAPPVAESTPDGAVDESALLQLAAKFEALRQPGSAEAVYRKVLEDNPASGPAWHALGLLAFEAGKPALAVGMLEEAARVDGKEGIYRRNLCEIHRRMGQLEEAIDNGRIACKLCPQDAEAHHYLGLALTNARRFKEAMPLLRKAVELDPRHVHAWNNLAVALHLSGESEGAKQAYRRVLEIMPTHPDAKKNLAMLGRGLAA